MGQFKIGNLSLSSAYLGENKVQKIYLGEVLLFPNENESFRTDEVNTEVSSNIPASDGTIGCTTAQMRDADYLNSMGFDVTKVGE